MRAIDHYTTILKKYSNMFVMNEINEKQFDKVNKKILKRLKEMDINLNEFVKNTL